ncbi:MAG: DNA-3-methyladenine glycosylase, partial [Candidatus Limnocylindrales bacterium]
MAGDSIEAARALLGAQLVREDASGIRAARIVELEAYGGPVDRASHARAGRTPRTAIMYGPPGVAYVYLVYGMHHCLNIVTGPEGFAGAVLVRAVEPIQGLGLMRAARLANRGAGHAPDRIADERLASGPGLVCRSFDIDRSLTGVDLCDPKGGVRIEARGPDDRDPVPGWTARIGVEYAGEPWASLAWRLVDRS